MGGLFDTQGCNGGLPSHAFEYIKHAGGLSTEFSYPYHAKDEKCKFNASASVTAPQGQRGSPQVLPGDERASERRLRRRLGLPRLQERRLLVNDLRTRR